MVVITPGGMNGVKSLYVELESDGSEVFYLIAQFSFQLTLHAVQPP